MNVDNDGQSVMLKEMPHHIASQYRLNSKREGEEKESQMDNPGMLARKLLKMGIKSKREINKSSHFVQNSLPPDVNDSPQLAN
jgi:hypothetical protein